MTTLFQPPPTYALPVLVDERTGKSAFNPIWLRWFLDLSSGLSSAGAGSGTVTSVSAGTGLSGGPITTTGALALQVPVTIAHGGTEATTAAEARTSLGLGTLALQSTDNLTLDKTSGVGIKVDPATPTFGWRDIISSIEVRGSGANDPTFAVYTGTSLRAYSFSASSMKEVFFTFHMPHDYVPGTDIYFHAHWSNAAAVPNTGNVVWGFEYTFAKGFGQQAFPATTTVTVTAACPATRYMHNISETTAVTIAGLEVDGMLLIRGYRDATNAADTCTDAVFLHTMDIHYQSSNMATKNKAPNFYA